MKQEIDPRVAAGIVIGIVVVAGVAIWAGTAAQRATKEPPGMPPAVAAEFQQRMQSAGMSPSGAVAGGGRTAGSSK